MNKIYNRKSAAEIFYASLKSVDPYVSVKRHAGEIRSAFTNGNFNRLLVAGFGKAACPMAKAIEDGLGDIIDKGIVITKYGHCESGKSEIKNKNV